jgi:deoxycytidine triphosphate deaminase
MSLFSDYVIKSRIEDGSLLVEPFDPSRVQPASLDLTLGRDFIQYVASDEPIDPEKPESLDRFSADSLILYPLPRGLRLGNHR